MYCGKCIHAIKYGRNELAHVKVKTNLNCHSREEHVKGHRRETIPEDENSFESYFDCHHKRLHVWWIIVLENELSDLDTHVWGPNVLQFTTKWSRISNADICQYWQWSMKLTSSRMSWGSQNRWRSSHEHLGTLKRKASTRNPIFKSAQCTKE